MKSRIEIEAETNHGKLKTIGREMEADGHKVKLNASTNNMRKEILGIYDKHYITEEEKAQPAPPEPEEPAVKPKESTPKRGRYVANVAYKDWASGWSFTPGMDKPKPLPKELSQGLKDAIKDKNIVPFYE